MMAHAAPTSSAPIQTEVLVDGPFSAALLFWRARRGELRCSIIAKTTYALKQRLSPLVEPSDALRTVDVPWYGAPEKSIRTPSDLVPFKHSPEVMVVGHAYSPGKKPQKRLAVRLLLGDLDSALEVFPPRRFLSDDSLEEPQAARMPLAYEYAAGGSESDNPVGVDTGLVDAWGRRGAPSVLLLGTQLSHPSDPVDTAGWGPIAPSWPSRARRLRAEDRTWLADPAYSPMPAAFDVRFFQSAPHEHWLSGPIRPDERLVLEHLSPQHERIVTNLDGVVPYASVIGSKELRVPLIADSLFIDTDRAIITLTWRGLVLVDERAPSLMVLVASTPGRGSILPPSPTAEERPEIEMTRAETLPGGIPKMPLPFPMPAPNERPLSPDYDDDALPFRTPDADLSQTQPRPAFRMTPVPPEPVAVPPPPPRIVAPEPPPPAPSMRAAPEPPPPPRPSFTSPPAPSAAASPPPQPSFMSSPAASPAPSFAGSSAAVPPSPKPAISSSAALPPPPGPVLGSAARSGGAAWAPPIEPRGRASAAAPSEGAGEGTSGAAAGWMSLRSVSDAAADADGRAGKPQERKGEPERRSAAKDAAGEPRRHAFVDLLAHDPALPARLRRTPAFSKLLASQNERPAWVRPDEPIDERSREDRGRLDVLRVLSFGAPCDLPRVRELLDDAFEDATQLELPLVVVAGQLKPSHDDLALLRATVRAGQPLSLTNKPLQAALKVLEEAAEGGVAPSGEATQALLRQAEQAAGTMWTYLNTQVQRMILEERQFKRRTVLGEQRIRAELSTPSGESVPAYVPAAVAPSLPMLASFPVVVLGELRPREDAQETHAEAFLVWAVGRVVRQVGRSPR